MEECSVNTAAILYPWLISDVAYSLYGEFIKPLQLRQQVKQSQKAWGEAFRELYRNLFGFLTPDEMCEVTDLMDDMEDAIHNDIVRLRVSVLSQIKHDDLDVRKCIANGYVCIASLLGAADGFMVFHNLYCEATKSRCLSLRSRSIDKAIRCGAHFITTYAASHGIYNVDCGEDILNNRIALETSCAKWAEGLNFNN